VKFFFTGSAVDFIYCQRSTNGLTLSKTGWPKGTQILLGRSEGPVGGTSDFLGYPPPDPRFLASLGALSWVELIYLRGLRTRMFSLACDGAVPVTARRAKRENGGLGEDPPGSTMREFPSPPSLDNGRRFGVRDCFGLGALGTVG
jgi:hypothetical protein